MRRYINQKLIYIVENILNPSSFSYLLHEKTLETAPSFNGKAKYNFAAFAISGKVVIEKITASLTTNNSQVGRQIQPITNLSFFTTTVENLHFYKKIDESKLVETNFKFNGIPKVSHSQLSKTYFNASDKVRVPENIVSFDADLNKELIYLPHKVKGVNSIVDEIVPVYNCSFDFYFQDQPQLEIPSQAKYLLIFPTASLPIPPSRIRVSQGTIAVGIDLYIAYTEI
ncbi:MAG: hypothetical protein SFU98_07280 [Leptospiraceae bacterium]|nr:hypothetical protein [Leptospiraceae bacterium]